jgi:hypothetical protein
MTPRHFPEQRSFDSDRSLLALPHAAIATRDTDPSRPMFDSAAAAARNISVDPIEVDVELDSTMPGMAPPGEGASLPRGRRHRSRPDLEPIFQASSSGEHSAAYYADTKPFVPRFDTLPPAEAPVHVRIASSTPTPVLRHLPLPPPASPAMFAPPPAAPAMFAPPPAQAPLAQAPLAQDSRSQTTFTRKPKLQLGPYVIALAILLASAMITVAIWHTRSRPATHGSSPSTLQP